MADSCFKANDDRGEKLLAEKNEISVRWFRRATGEARSCDLIAAKKQKDKEKIEQKRKRDDIEIKSQKKSTRKN